MTHRTLTLMFCVYFSSASFLYVEISVLEGRDAVSYTLTVFLYIEYITLCAVCSFKRHLVFVLREK